MQERSKAQKIRHQHKREGKKKKTQENTKRQPTQGERSGEYVSCVFDLTLFCDCFDRTLVWVFRFPPYLQDGQFKNKK
jgi:hypothetical protein